MTTVELFYTPPKDECFEELRTICIRFWRTFDEVEYVDEKINRIKNLKNEGCNFVMMVQMIHPVSREFIAKAFWVCKLWTFHLCKSGESIEISDLVIASFTVKRCML